MKTVHKIELKLEDFEKCSMVLDSDCPLGQLFDYACSLKHFIMQRMKEAEEIEKQRQDAKQELEQVG